MRIAQDYLGGAGYGKVILENHPFGEGAGFFDNEFGDCKPVVKKLVESKPGRCPMVRIQMLWAGKSHNYGDKDIPRIIAIAKKWQTFKKNHPDTDVYLSPFCEHTLKNPDKYLDIVKQYAPNCVPVNSPLKSGALSTKYINEFHGAENPPRKSKTPTLFSFDGTSAVDSDVTTYKNNYKNVEWFFLWIPQYNQHKSMKPADGALRDCVPTDWQIKSVDYLKTDKGNTVIPKHWILKSHADQHNAKPEPRAGKPVIIAPDVGEFIRFKSGDTIVTSMKKGELFRETGYPVKRYIYRELIDYGYQLSNKSIVLSGSPRLDIIANGKKVGVCNLAFRDGTFR